MRELNELRECHKTLVVELAELRRQKDINQNIQKTLNSANQLASTHTEQISVIKSQTEVNASTLQTSFEEEKRINQQLRAENRSFSDKVTQVETSQRELEYAKVLMEKYKEEIRELKT